MVMLVMGVLRAGRRGSELFQRDRGFDLAGADAAPPGGQDAVGLDERLGADCLAVVKLARSGSVPGTVSMAVTMARRSAW